MKFLTLINTGLASSDVILGYGSGHQILKYSAIAAGGLVLEPVWIVFEQTEAIQWQITASTIQASLHGQVLTAV